MCGFHISHTCKQNWVFVICNCMGQMIKQEEHQYMSILHFTRYLGCVPFGVIRVRISDPRSVWIMVHQRNRRIHSGHGFAGSFGCTMIHTDLGSLIRTRITPKERTRRLL